jgi:Protein of unknown function (DUF4236)
MLGAMGFRFYRRLRLFPGVRLNFSKSGVSTSIGGRGHWITFGGKRAPTVTLGVPGTGLRYTQQLGNHSHVDPSAAVVPPAAPSRLARIVRAVLWLTVLAIAAVLVARLIPP